MQKKIKPKFFKEFSNKGINKVFQLKFNYWKLLLKYSEPKKNTKQRHTVWAIRAKLPVNSGCTVQKSWPTGRKSIVLNSFTYANQNIAYYLLLFILPIDLGFHSHQSHIITYTHGNLNQDWVEEHSKKKKPGFKNCWCLRFRQMNGKRGPSYLPTNQPTGGHRQCCARGTKRVNNGETFRSKEFTFGTTVCLLLFWIPRFFVFLLVWIYL